MPTLPVEAVLGFGALLTVCFVVWTWLRRRRIADGGVVVLSGLATTEQPRWRLGLLRLGPTHLEWFTMLGPGLHPAHAWLRSGVDLGAPSPLPEDIPGLPGALEVTVRRAMGTEVKLALQPAASKAVRAWIESSPPGYNVNVA
ncbi:MAG: DUF2550 family protein [Nostocoides sp.]